MKNLFVVAILAISLVSAVVSVSGLDYISQPPPTVYEASTVSPQNMDFDQTNNMFIAHPGWLNDKLIHYYKFRMFTPATYPTKVSMQGTPNIPIAPLYLVATSAGDFSSVVSAQKPIIRWHTSDGENYSDFVQVYWVVVDSSYQANTYRSYEDVTSNVPESNIIASNIYVNFPVVPTGSSLQDPVSLGTTLAPIKPVTVWYRGVEVQTFVFETTSQPLADYYNPLTREGSAANKGSGYEITVAPNLVTQGQVNSIPIFHLNQYPMGVVTGVNHGGPWKGGGRNIIGRDRGDNDYSPLWQVFWVAHVPIDYSTDMASDQAQLAAANGFQVIATPMYVNCPNIGPRGGGDTNSKKASAFRQSVAPGETFTVAGALVMEADKTVKAYLGGRELGSAKTNMMGAYMFNLSADQLPEGKPTISIKDDTGNLLVDISVSKSGAIFGLLPTIPTIAGIIVAVATASVLVMYRRRHKQSKKQP